jgi:hypothetical protein
MNKENWINAVMTSTKYPHFDVNTNLYKLKEIQKNRTELNISLNWFWPVAAIWLISTLCVTKLQNQKTQPPLNNNVSNELKNIVQIESYQIY